MKPRAYSPYAGLPRRLAAVLLDAALALFLLTVVCWLLRLDAGTEAALVTEPLAGYAVLAGAPVIIGLFWLLFQGTPGKLLLGCRLVDARSGGHPHLWQVLARLIGYALSSAPAGLGFFWMLWDRRCQGWHDKLARTLVVLDDESSKTLEQLSAESR